MRDKQYIGDGVYVQHDDFGGIWLTTENGISVTNKICLEPEVMRSLREYDDRMRQRFKDGT